MIPKDGGWNRWTSKGFLRLAWDSVGIGRRHRPTGAVDVQSSHRGREAASSLAALSFAAQEHALSVALCVYLEHGFDATPMLLRFGQLRGALQEHARYLAQVSSDPAFPRWTTVPFEEWKKQNPRAPSVCGVLEVFAQRSELFWVSASGGEISEHARVLRYPPMILQRANSSCMFSAKELMDSVSLNQLERLSAGSWVVLGGAPDACKANRRLIAYEMSLMGPRVLHYSTPCMAHSLHLAVVSTTAEADIVGNSHAVQFVYGIAGRREEIWKALKALNRGGARGV